jgi:HEPN domain-containing protein
MIDRMGSPFRYRKKERKRWRRRAKKDMMAAKRFEAEGIKPWAAARSRRLAAFDLRMARAKCRKKTKPKNPN